MYKSLYSEMAGDTSAGSREQERLAFARSIELLEAASRSGPASRDAIDALYFVNRLWATLLEDLAHDGNDLPDSLKAGLISIGIWVLRRVEEIRMGKSTDFSALIDVTRTINSGLMRG